MSPWPRNADPDTRTSLLVGLVLLPCYWYTAARTVVLEDDGYFLQAAWFNAVAHPPGYPLYVALSHLATLVPVGTPALRVHALTGLFAAVACVLLYHLARRLDLSRPGAAIAAAVFGLSGAFWSQAVIAEVYSLNVLLFLACALAALAWGRRPDAASPRALALGGLVYGLGLANHWPLLVLSTPALLALAWPARRMLLRRGAYLAAGIGAGLLPYAWMIWRTHVVPEYCFAGPITSWEEFRFYVAREGYAAMDHNPGAGWGDRLRFAGFVARELPAQFGWPGTLLAAAGFLRQWRTWPASVCVALVLGFLGSTLLLIGLLGFDYDELHRNTFRVYPLIAYTVVALWLGLGLHWFLAWCPVRVAAAQRLPATVMAILLVGGVFLAHLPENLRRDDRWAETYGRAVLESLPPGARFYGNADTVNGPVGYLHRVLGMRPDITFVTGTSLPVDGVLHRPYAMAAAALEALIDAYVKADPRPVFYSNGFPQPFAQADYGLYFGVDTEAAPGKYRAATAAVVVDYFSRLDAVDVPGNPWNAMHYRLLRQDQCRWLVARAGGALPRDAAALPGACLGLQGRLWLGRQLAGAGDQAAELVRDWLPPEPEILRQAVTKAESREYLALRAWAEARTREGDRNPARGM